MRALGLHRLAHVERRLDQARAQRARSIQRTRPGDARRGKQARRGAPARRHAARVDRNRAASRSPRRAPRPRLPGAAKAHRARPRNPRARPAPPSAARTLPRTSRIGPAQARRSSRAARSSSAASSAHGCSPRACCSPAASRSRAKSINWVVASVWPRNCTPASASWCASSNTASSTRATTRRHRCRAGQVGEEQMVVDHHHVGRHGLAPRLHHVAAAVLRAVAAEAVLARRGDQRDHRRALVEAFQLGQVAAAGVLRPLLDARQRAHRKAVGQLRRCRAPAADGGCTDSWRGP